MRCLGRSVECSWNRTVDDVGRAVGDAFAAWSRALSQLGLSSVAPATGMRASDDALSWHTIDVGGAPVVFGRGGSGPPVLFLHGWGLGSRTYKRPLRRLTARGTQVFAPAMPGFGGSGPLAGADVQIEDYADWAASFLDAVGVEEPALVIGHSFGGGVATALAHRHPSRVRYLVLLNAVGGATWDGRRGRSLSERPLTDWVAGFSREFAVLEGVETLGAAARDVLTNVMTNPFVLAHAGELARDADLTAELAELRTRGLPVLALTSERDEVIPAEAFGTLVEAVGAEGRVVRGNHMWVLADPDHFDDVLRNVIDVEVQEHQRSTAATSAEHVRELLVATGIPAPTADALVADAPPLWMLTDAPSTLATDLALCHPALSPGEVRAVATRLDGGAVRLAVVAEDRPGLLADTAGVLAGLGLSVARASASTWPASGAGSGLALHTLELANVGSASDEVFDVLGDRLRSATTDPPTPPWFQGSGRTRVRVSGNPAHRATVTVVAPDQVGLLWAVCDWFAERDVTIEAVDVSTTDGVARDTFVVVGDCDPAELADHLAGRSPARSA